MNIDHVATVRNARGTVYPDPLRAALLAEQAGADLITLHLREDRRHIKDADVLAIRPQLMTRMNLEAAVTQEMIDFACQVKPQDVCLVPERREEVTTEGGLDVIRYHKRSRSRDQAAAGRGHPRVAVHRCRRSSRSPPPPQLGAPVIELHTGRYAEAEGRRELAHELERIKPGVRAGVAARPARERRPRPALHQRAGDRRASPTSHELNIGHAIVAQAVFAGFENAVREMKAIMVGARLGVRAGRGQARCMIYGIGTDIVQISRIEAALARNGERFAEKILGPRGTGKIPRPPRQERGARPAFPGHAVFGQGSVFEGDRPGHAHAHDLAQRPRCSTPRAASPSSSAAARLKNSCENTVSAPR